jgi:hypothetical protein
MFSPEFFTDTTNRIGFFDTLKECEETTKLQLVEKNKMCAPADWFKPHRWWQFWK